MHVPSFMPLRTTVSDSVAIIGVQVLDHAPEIDPAEIRVGHIATTSSGYRDFNAERLLINGQLAKPGPGVHTYPAPGELPRDLARAMRGPFNLFEHFIRLAVTGPRATTDDQVSKRLWLEIELILDTKRCPVIGGLVYGGYPFLPYYVTPQGANSANFGLPRELGVVWEGATGKGFLDDQVGITQQETTSHSGVHVLATGPVRADRLRVRIGDFPRILLRSKGSGGATKLREVWGVLIPYLGVFSYAEDVRFAPYVPAGLLAATHVPARSTQAYFDPASLSQAAQRQVASVAADLVHVTHGPDEYFPLSAASLFHEPRQYEIHTVGRRETTPEIFLSQKLETGDQVRIYFEQAEEHRRCLSGLLLTGAEEKLVNWYVGENAARFDVEAFELDPIEGVSPIAPERDPATDKYTAILARRRDVRFDAQQLSLPFLRQSATRQFVLVFTCRSAGFLGLARIELVQSAHVAVTPRTSRRQRVTRLNFRLIGAQLAEDYSRLGRRGFAFTIEHVVGGELKRTLFEARSLSDLLQLSGARLYANQRYLETRRDVSSESAVTLPNSYERRYSQVGSHGWRRSQSGNNVDWDRVGDPSRLQIFPDNPGTDSFQSRSNAETRSRNRHLGMNDDSTQLVNALNAIETLLQLPANTIVNPPSRNALTNGNGWGTGAGEAWEGFQASSLRNLGGMLNVSVPPINLPIAAYQKILDAFADPAGAVQTLPSFLAGATFSQFLVLNGAGLGVNVGTSGNVTVGPISGGLSGGFSFSTSQLLPTVTRTSALGSTGNITYQASRTRASYSQSLNDGYDESESYAETREGVSNRQVSRDLFQPGTVRERAVGVGVHWREMPLDVLVGSIPLSLNLPATADKVYDNNDEWVRVRFVNGMGDGLKAILPADQPSQCDEFHDAVMDVWFELTEEVLRDDY